MESKLFGVTLLAWLWLVTGSPFYSRTFIPDEAIKNGSYIKYYTEAHYDSEILKQHWARTIHDSLSIGKKVGATLNLHLNVSDRIFKIKLVRDTSIFHNDAHFEMSNGHTISYNPLNVYIGCLEDDETSVVHGIITKDGLFDGTVITSTDEIYIEPTARYSHLLRPDTINMNQNYHHHHHHHHHTIAYRSSDIAIPSTVPLRLSVHERLVGNDIYNFTHTFNESEMGDVNQFVDLDADDDDDDDDNNNDGGGGDDDNEENLLNLELFPHDVNHYTVELMDRLYRERFSRILSKHTSIDPKKTTCMLYLQADHTFFDHYKSEEACIEVMTRHVQRVNSIYRYTDFNQDGQPDNISFMIKRIKIHGPETFNDPTYRFTGKFGVEEYLEMFSEENYDAFCLSYMFTYRDFEKGTLGLAWTGDLKNAGGVCEKNGHYRGSMKSLNTGIITLLNYGKHVPPAVSHVTLAHEIGHNFGSPHDPDECSPGGEDGNFIMFARATSGDKRNNNRFSPCSLISINPVLNFKARSIKGCFAEHQAAICGNGVVEEGEECDCGWEEDCNDPCCHPQRLHHAPFEIPCRLTEDAVCSPSQGPCCTSECSLRIGTKCRDDNGCRDASFCDGRGPQCPPSVNKPNKTICNEEFVCYMGECTGSICLAYGLESCQCTAKPNDPPTKTCELCCKLPGEDQPCISSYEWNSPPYEIPGMMSKPGTPCNDYNGYCDIFQRCREVDPTGPLATLRRLLLSDASLERFQRWMTDRWYSVALGILLAATGLIIVTRLLSKRVDANLKIIYMTDDTTKNLPKKYDDQSFRVVEALKNISRFKRRIVETMKTITLPRKKNDMVSVSGDDTKIYGKLSVHCTLPGNYDHQKPLHFKSSTIIHSNNCHYDNNQDEVIKILANNYSHTNENLSIQHNWPYVRFIEKLHHNNKIFDIKKKILDNSPGTSDSIAHVKNNSSDNNLKLNTCELPKIHNRIFHLQTLLRNS